MEAEAKARRTGWVGIIHPNSYSFAKKYRTLWRFKHLQKSGFCMFLFYHGIFMFKPLF